MIIFQLNIVLSRIMNYKIRIRAIVLVMVMAIIGKGLPVDINDLLNGEGLFHNQTLGDFQQDHQHITQFLVVNGSNVLKLQKPASSQISFQTGLQYSFIASQPVHVSFQFSSVSHDTEDANLRLIDSSTKHTVLLFRAGKAGFIRVNQNQMISFYNSSVSTDTDIKTIKMDILLYWNTSTVQVFVNGQWKGSANFFQPAQSVDELRLYNLYQSTSYWKNLVVCSQICYSFNNGSILKTNLFSFIALLLILLISL